MLIFCSPSTKANNWVAILHTQQCKTEVPVPPGTGGFGIARMSTKLNKSSNIWLRFFFFPKSLLLTYVTVFILIAMPQILILAKNVSTRFQWNFPQLQPNSSKWFGFLSLLKGIVPAPKNVIKVIFAVKWQWVTYHVGFEMIPNFGFFSLKVKETSLAALNRNHYHV